MHNGRINLAQLEWYRHLEVLEPVSFILIFKQLGPLEDTRSNPLRKQRATPNDNKP